MSHLAVLYFSLISLEEKGKAALMLKPSSKRKRGNISMIMNEEEKSDSS